MSFGLRDIALIGLIAATGALGLGLYQVRNEHKEKMSVSALDCAVAPSDSSCSEISCNVMNETTVKNKRQLWSEVQQKFKDTVAQVFSQATEFNWLEPYKTPNQAESMGSSFFINDKGELLTNAHVVEQAKTVMIQVPTLGKRRFEVEIVGVSPDRDLALLRLLPSELEALKKALGKNELPYLKLGNSDTIYRADKIMALGYPLGQQGLKSTTGVVSGREHLQGQHFIQISAPINKGNSGGPSLNCLGDVIGINSAGVPGAQNVGYIIPINEAKLFLKQIDQMPKSDRPTLLRKPFLGVLFNNATESLTAYLKNPVPGGLYVVEAYKGSPLAKAGVKSGDMIYEIDGHSLDIYGEMNVAWNLEDKISVMDYISRLKIGDDVRLVFYRNGERKEVTIKFTSSELAPIRRMFPGYEKIDYEVLGGMVVMPMTLNHIMLLAQYTPDLIQYADFKKQMEPLLLISHVQLNSPAYRSRALGMGAVISEVNGQKVRTLDEYRAAIMKSVDTKYLTIKTSENIFVVLPLEEIMRDEARLAATYFYPISDTYEKLKQALNPEPVKPKGFAL